MLRYVMFVVTGTIIITVHLVCGYMFADAIVALISLMCVSVTHLLVIAGN